MESVATLLGGIEGLPHGACLLWETRLIWLHAVSDAFIALACYAMAVAIL